MQPWMPGGVNRQGIGAGGRVLGYDIYIVYKGVGLVMGAVARNLHDTAQAVTSTFTSHRHFSIIVSQFD